MAERSIKLSGVDLVDGTPVLDVKPYVPDYDCPQPRYSPASECAGGDGGVRVAVSGVAGVEARRYRGKGWGGEGGMVAYTQLVGIQVAHGVGARAFVDTPVWSEGG